MRKFSFSIVVVLCLAATAKAQTQESIVPAGTLLQCTIDEPNFSSRTAHVGDPILCHVSSLGMFGRPVFPRGAYLSGRFQDFHDPGHFFGKGWLKLEFETLTVPGGTFPVSAKVVSHPHYRVDAEGRIRGGGHARRDAVEWALPVLWPEKVITLPMRGPRPTLKGETRILLRLLEDFSIPSDATERLSAAVSKPAASKVNPNTPTRIFPKLRYGGTSMPAAEGERSTPTRPFEVEEAGFSETNRPTQTQRPWRATKATLLMLKDGQAYLVKDYWMDTSHVVFVSSDGSQRLLPLGDLDFQLTLQLNRERGVPFVFQTKPTEP
jgi:hypothetical protein